MIRRSDRTGTFNLGRGVDSVCQTRSGRPATSKLTWTSENRLGVGSEINNWFSVEILTGAG